MPLAPADAAKLEEFAALLRTRIAEESVELRAIADRLGVGTQALATWTGGRTVPGLSSRDRLARFLRMTPARLAALLPAKAPQARRRQASGSLEGP